MNQAAKVVGTNRKAIQREAIRDDAFADALAMAKAIGADIPAKDPPLAVDATLPVKRVIDAEVIEAEVVEPKGKGKPGLDIPTDEEVEALLWRLAKGFDLQGQKVHSTVQRTAIREMTDLRFKSKERAKLLRGMSNPDPTRPRSGRGLTERVTEGVRESIIGPPPDDDE